MTSPSAAEIALPASRVASERMKTLGRRIAFMRMRSPSSAPPVLRRVGSTESTAIFSASPWSSAEAPHQLVGERALPAPPVPVMPSTGTRGLAALFLERRLRVRSAETAPFRAP